MTERKDRLPAEAGAGRVERRRAARPRAAIRLKRRESCPGPNPSRIASASLGWTHWKSRPRARESICRPSSGGKNKRALQDPDPDPDLDPDPDPDPDLGMGPERTSDPDLGMVPERASNTDIRADPRADRDPDLGTVGNRSTPESRKADGNSKTSKIAKDANTLSPPTPSR